MGSSPLRVGTALLLASLVALPASGTTVPEYAVTKLDAHFSSLDTLQSLVDLFMGRDPSKGTANTSTTRWGYFLGNAYNLTRIVVNSTISSGGGGDATNLLFVIPFPAPAAELMSDPSRCDRCAENITRGLAILANNSTSIFGDAAGTTGRARVWREYQTQLASADASRNVSRLVQMQTSLIRDAFAIYTENLKQTYSMLGV